MLAGGIRALMAGTWAAQAVYVAAELDIAHHLAGGPRTSGEVAAACGAHPQAIHRLMRALAGLGLFSVDDGHFTLTPTGRLLARDAPGSLRSLAIWNGEVSHRMWTGALDVVKDGIPATRRLLGTEQWQYLSTRPDLRSRFDEAMAGIALQTASEVLSALDLSRFHSIVDVGGGSGALLAAILERHPLTRGVLFDRPEAAAAARHVHETFGERFAFVGGDFLVEVPSGADLYILSSVLHDWDDDTAAAILRTCRAAMTGHARLLIVECVLCSEPGQILPVLLDLQMLVMTGGRERTDEEYRALLHSADLQIESLTPLPGAESVVIAAPRSAGSH